MNITSSARPFLALTLLSLFACEQSVDPVDIPYIERMVIRSFVEPGEMPMVEISHTLPLDRQVSHREQWILDADARLRSEPGEFQRMSPIFDNSGYYRTEKVEIESGRHYHLDVRWQGRHVEATTRVPFAPEIAYCRRDTSTDENGELRIPVRIGVRPRDGEYYGAAVRLVDSLYETTFQITQSRVLGIEDTVEGGIIEFSADVGWYGGDSLIAIVTAYDRPFKAFAATFYNDFGNNDAFSIGSDRVAWNVNGDAIGIFIGRAISRRRIP